MRKTDALSVILGKLGPLVLIFGAYLIAFGHLSPGGGFQGGVVLASGILLMAMGRGADPVFALLTPRILIQAEAVAFVLLLAVGLAGTLSGTGFLGGFPASGDKGPGGSAVGFIITLNILIGLKVGAGVTYLCLFFLKDADV